MDDDGMGIRNWGYFEQPRKSNLGLQLMSTIVERDTKPLLRRDPAYMVPPNGSFLYRDCGVPQTPVPMDFVSDSWITQREKLLHILPNHQNYASQSEPCGNHHPLLILPQPELLKDEGAPRIDNMDSKRDGPLKKRSNGRAHKAPTTKITKKAVSKDESSCSVPRNKPGKKYTGVVINGIDIDISGLPVPICSCTGNPQQCYKWGIGGWQSACCTTNISMYPLPMSTKRCGARMAGRKMSLGAFKKVLEKLASEGHSLLHPIDLKTHWAKHGTNKFVTIR